MLVSFLNLQDLFAHCERHLYFIISFLFDSPLVDIAVYVVSQRWLFIGINPLDTFPAQTWDQDRLLIYYFSFNARNLADSVLTDAEYLSSPFLVLVWFISAESSSDKK